MNKSCEHTGTCNCVIHSPTEIEKLAKTDLNKAHEKFEDVKHGLKEDIQKHQKK
jgi:hypothetical protein